MQVQPDSILAPGTERYIEQFEAFQEKLPGNNLPWLSEYRKNNLARFGHQGFPSQKDEDWRYTSPRPIVSKEFQSAADIRAVPKLHEFEVENYDGYRIVLVDGKVLDNGSIKNLEEQGVRVFTMADALQNEIAEVEQYLGSALDAEVHGFTALNNAMFSDGIVIIAEPSAVLDKPVEVLHLSDSELAISNLRNLVVAKKGSKIQLIERFQCTAETNSLTNSVSEFVVEQDAEVDHYLIQLQSRKAYHVCGVWASQSDNSRYSCRTITLGGALVRNDLKVIMSGEQAHCDMFGLYSLAGKQHTDNHTTMIHDAESCTSNELYKGVLNQRAHGVFHGRIKVCEDAQKTDAQQANNTLLLSRDAEIDTKPQLEIYADDVKCSHGATIGQMDESSLFFLQCRGIDRDAAKSLLTYAFVVDVLNSIEVEPLKVHLEAILADQLISEDQL